MTVDSRGSEACDADDRADDPVADRADGRGSRRRLTRWAVAISAVVTALGAAACAGPPSNGDVRSASLSQSHNNVFIVAREPLPGMNPPQLVQGFLQALTGDQKDPGFTVAQEYLTAETQKSWIKPGPTLDEPTKIVDKFEVAQDDQSVSADKGSRAAPVQESQPLGTETTVTFTATQVAELDKFGFYRVTPPDLITFPFTVKLEAVGWRIEKVPPYRPIELDSFKRVYQTYQSALPVYLPGSGGQQLDQVYLTQATGKIDYTFNALAEAVLNGRVPGRSPALELAQPVRVNQAGTAEVDLKVPPGSAPDLDALQSALMQTFRDAAGTQQLLGATPQLTGVLVTYQGCPSTICAVQPLGSLPVVPVPGVYWVCPQTANSEAAVVFQQPSPGSSSAPACTPTGPKPKPAFDLSGVKVLKDAPIAVRQTSDAARGKASTQTTTVAVVVADTAKGSKGGSVVVAGDKTGTDRRTWYTTNDVAKLTDLEWDPVDGTLWVVDKNTLYRVHDPGDQEPSADTRDQIPIPAGGAQLTRFKPAPDGRHAVVVSDVGTATGSTGSTGGATCAATGGSTSSCPALMVAIDRGGDVPTLSQDSVFALLPETNDPSTPRSTLTTATDAAWADGRTVVLLGTSKESNIPKLFKVYADGSQDSVIIDPEDAQASAKHIAAATGVYNGHSALWVVSDGAAPSDPNSTFVYFKGRAGADSNPEPGASPVVATVGVSS